MELPIGTIVAWSGKIDTLPNAWLPCDGMPRKKSQYPKLADVMVGIWGNPSPLSGTEFKVPNLNGQFLRGVDNNSGKDPDSTSRTDLSGNVIGGIVGSYQLDAVKNHSHQVTDRGHHHSFAYRTEGQGRNIADGGDGVGFQLRERGETDQSNSNISIPESGGGAETRSKNAYVYWIIKAL